MGAGKTDFWLVGSLSCGRDSLFLNPPLYVVVVILFFVIVILFERQNGVGTGISGINYNTFRVNYNTFRVEL